MGSLAVGFSIASIVRAGPKVRDPSLRRSAFECGWKVRLARIELAASCSAGKRHRVSGGFVLMPHACGADDALVWRFTDAR